MQQLVNLVRGDDEIVRFAEFGQFQPPFAAERAAAWVVVAGDGVEQGGPVRPEPLAQNVGAAFGELGPLGLFAGLLLVAILLTQVLENSAAAVVLSPVAFEMAESVGADPRAFLLGMAICCSAGFATPMAHECTLLVMGPGGYRFRDFLAIGAPLALLTWIVTILAVPWFFPF